MPALYERAGLFWYAFLPYASQRNALKLILSQAQHLDQNDDRSCQLCDGRYTSQKVASAVYGISIGFASRAALRQLNNHK